MLFTAQMLSNTAKATVVEEDTKVKLYSVDSNIITLKSSKRSHKTFLSSFTNLLRGRQEKP